MKKLGLPLVALFLVVANGTLLVHALPRASREDDIREVVFRQIVMTDTPSPSPPVAGRADHDPPELPASYISYWQNGHDADPSNDFLKRFAGHTPPVKKLSDSYIHARSKDPGWSVVKDKKSHAFGIRVYVGRIVWQGRNRVNVRAGYEAGALNASQARYWLRFVKGQWKVVKITDSLVS